MNTAEADPLVVVIVLNYNGRDHLEYCLPSIAQTDYANLHVLVVDNASSDDSLDYVRAHHPNMEIIASATNRGWSGGNNLGLARAQELGAAYVILNNNDVRVDPRWVRQAVAAAQQDGSVGAVCFRIMEPRGGPRDAGFTQAVADWSSLESFDAPRLDGIALFPMAVLDLVGWVDEGFFVYGEDNDLEYRLRQSGFRIVRTNIPLWHHGSASFSRVPLRAGALQIRGDLRLALKQRGPAGIAYEWLRHLAIACLPFVRFAPQDDVKRRLRPSNIFVNFGILMYATAWNLRHLPGTLRQRRLDAARIRAARRSLGLPTR